ncbi:uncharacterized protein B0H18DRAFT_1034167 [Fomitopsis serialis]|uniref:uncharacterized protein n=1 Tax=Fomitopsis serialis TaxID=139415 RepID=UPI00200764CF|nr:uncharacterized protein B0H18DRAFT_1034167 [Neoantrodia serialis]KAH9917550.1 hypothetical protein B0H18DRAFT_1034167 [Neoantrodia serialis]
MWTVLRVAALKGLALAVLIRLYLPAKIPYITLLLNFKFLHVPLRKHAPSLCSQGPPLVPQTHEQLWNATGRQLSTEAFVNRTADLLSGAVRIPTEVYDVMGPIGEDSRWEAFAPLHDYLWQAFPQIHTTLLLTKINTFGLVYVWQGSDDALKPILLTAHQDVVPVDPTSIANWTHSPYSGHFDGTYTCLGQGSADDKNGLISILGGDLLEHDFVPARTVVLAFGFDEEATGLQGAYRIGQHLLQVFGENAFAMLVDEGDPIEDRYGAPLARLAISEKGYFDLQIEVSAAGGHSSIPPAHTAIGLLSSLIVAYESFAPPARLTRTSAAYTHAQCLAAHAPLLPPALRADILAARTSDAALQRVEMALFEADPGLAAGGHTTVAVDVVWGGTAGAVVNHRVAVDSSVAALKNHTIAVLRPVAESLNLTVDPFPEDDASLADEHRGVPRLGPSAGRVVLSDAFDTALEPAPVSPTDSEQWRILAGTIRAAWGGPHSEHDSVTEGTRASQGSGAEVVVVPSLLAGIPFYWRLTPHIFRYNHYYARDGPADGNIHTVNEACEAQGLVGMVHFFIGLLLNVDETRSM